MEPFRTLTCGLFSRRSYRFTMLYAIHFTSHTMCSFLSKSSDQFKTQMDDCGFASLKESNATNLKQNTNSEKVNARSKLFKLR